MHKITSFDPPKVALLISIGFLVVLVSGIHNARTAHDEFAPIQERNCAAIGMERVWWNRPLREADDRVNRPRHPLALERARGGCVIWSRSAVSPLFSEGQPFKLLWSPAPTKGLLVVAYEKNVFHPKEEASELGMRGFCVCAVGRQKSGEIGIEIVERNRNAGGEKRIFAHGFILRVLDATPGRCMTQSFTGQG